MISDTINDATDSLTETLNYLTNEETEELLPLFREYLPKTMADLAFHRVHDHVPKQYIKNAIASCIASRIVYKGAFKSVTKEGNRYITNQFLFSSEGTEFVASLPKEEIGEILMKYIRKEKEIIQLKRMLQSTEMNDEEKQKILGLLEEGGVRTALVLPK